MVALLVKTMEAAGSGASLEDMGQWARVVGVVAQPHFWLLFPDLFDVSELPSPKLPAIPVATPPRHSGPHSLKR